MTEAQVERDRQRNESEARDIIHDIDRLNTYPESKKTRWVWELLQNAKDVATTEGVDAVFKLDEHQMTISHNGLPFETKHLLAILYKTSTKTLGGEDGTTGKYGTGFVTTHILNKKLNIEGVHQNENGKRSFSLEIDRTSAILDENEALAAMQESLNSTFNEIDAISIAPSEAGLKNRHSFIYQLTEYSRKYAEKGLVELERNIPFTLLINQGDKKKINSVTIIANGRENTFTVNSETSNVIGLKYIRISESDGILYKDEAGVIFGIPVSKLKNSYVIKSLQNQSVLFKEFPLVGTESFNLPVFIQHDGFKPTELRDSVRTKKEREDLADHTADVNRKALIDFVTKYLSFLSSLIDGKLSGLHFLALSGLPTDIEVYSNKDWFTQNIQKPIRSLLMSKDIVQTVSGDFIKIDTAIFPSAELVSDDDFYDLIASLLPKRVPARETIDFWNNVVHQEIECWPADITISLEMLLEKIPAIVDLEDENVFQVLGNLYIYLEKINSTLGEKFPIYLNEKRDFKTRLDVVLYPNIDNEIKRVSAGLGRDLDKEFLCKNLGIVSGIKAFELTDFYKNLNGELISSLSEKVANIEQINAILHVCSLFRSDRAIRREKWYSLVKQLLPDQIGEKKSITIDYEYYGSSAELWSIKYLSYLIEEEKTVNKFAEKYFQGEFKSTFEWLNDFLSHVFSLQEENRNVLFQRMIIPVQTGDFVAYSEYIYSEDDPKYFDDSIKDLYKDFIDKGDPRGSIVDNRIQIQTIRKYSIDTLTKEIDKLFDDPLIERKVKQGNELHNAFLTLNNWFEQFPDVSGDLKTFSNKRALLYVIALGDGFGKQIMSIKESGRSMEDIVELAHISLTTKEMKDLEKVALELGTSSLLAKAQQLVDVKHQRTRWQRIGKSAEDAFKKVFTSLEMEVELSNPDIGKDFEILLKSKGYSIEIKNVIEGKENVRMSILQGRTAVSEKDSYALCVLTRPNDDREIDEIYFAENARFVDNIGYQIGDRIKRWDEGLHNLSPAGEIRVNLDVKTETVYVSRPIWRDGLTFLQFVSDLKEYFKVEEQ